MTDERSFSHDVLRGLSNYIEDSLKRGIVCCPNCEHWLAMPEHCGLNNKKPPAPIIAFGCERFEPNQVPF